MIKILLNTSISVSESTYDAILVGAGIMSSTLALLLHELDPDLRLLIVERLSSAGLESSCAKNNAGTGHAANCELNYTPILEDGSLSTIKAFEINKSFEKSLCVLHKEITQLLVLITSLVLINESIFNIFTNLSCL